MVTLAAPWHTAQPSRAARLEQAIVDRQATLFGGLAFSPDGMLLAVTGWRSAALYNLAAGAEAFLPQPRLGGFSSLAYSPDGTILAAENADQGKSGTSNYLWSVASRRVLAILSYPNGGVSPLAFS